MTLQLPKARSKMRSLASVDRIAHWKMEETAGVTVVDAAGSSNLTDTTAADIVDGPFLGETNNKGRNFAATSSASGASTAGQRTALLGKWTLEVWTSITSIGVCAIVTHGNNLADATIANNILQQLALSGAGVLRMIWEKAAGVDVITGSVTMTTGLHHIAVRKRTPVSGTAGKVDLDFFVDGLLASTTADVDDAVDGTAGSWILGDQPGGGAAFNGVVYEVRVSAVALSDEAIRESYSRGVRDWDLARAIDSGHHVVHTRALIRDTLDVWHDLSDLYDVNFVGGFEDGADVDSDGANGKLTLRRRSAFLSLSPFMINSRIAAIDPSGQLLDVARRIKLEEAYLPHGASRDAVAGVHWQLVFDGYARVVSFASESMDLTLSGRERALHAAWCQPNRTPNPDEDFVYATSATPIETVIAAILTDHVPTSIGGTVEGYAGGDDVTLWVPTSPAYVVDNSPGGFSVPSAKSVMQALTDLVDGTLGWFLRFAFDEARQEFRLALLDPGRSKSWQSTDRTLAPRNILQWRNIETNDEDIRNDIEVEYGGPASVDNAGVNKRAMVRVEHAASVAQWWRRYARVGLASLSQINDVTQATNLANAILSDLAQPFADIEIEVLPRRDIGIGDIVKVLGDDVRTTAGFDLEYAVVGVQHTRRRDQRVTVLTARYAKPCGRRRRWQEWLAGVNKGAGLKPPPTPSAPTVADIAGGVIVSWPFAANAGNRRYRETEIHVSTTSGFTPSNSTLKAIVRGQNALALELDPTQTFFVKICHRDDMNNVSAASAQSSKSPRFTPKSPYVSATRTTSDQTTVSATEAIFYNTEVGDPFGNYNLATGAWTQTKTGTLQVQASVRWDANGKPSHNGKLGVYVNGVLAREGPTVTTNAGAAPNRATATLPLQLLHVTAADVVTFRVDTAAVGDKYMNHVDSWLTISGGGPHV